MRLDIKTTPKRAYRQIVEVMRSIPPLNKLRKRELDVLAIIMFYNYKYREVESTIRWRIISDVSTRREMQREIVMNEDTFNNNFSLLRRAGVITKTGELQPFMQIIISDRYEVKFDFKISEDEG